MAKQLFREEQKYHNYGLYLLISMLSLALIWQLLTNLVQASPSNWLINIPLLLLFAFVWLVIFKLRMRIKMSKKYIRIRISPWHRLGKVKLAWEEVESIHFFKFSEAAMLSGQALNFNTLSTSFCFGDRSGMQICTHDGREYLIFSSSIYRKQASIQEKLQDLHPDIEIRA